MKKTLKVAILLIAILSMGHWMPVKQVRDLNSLSLQNVEALASGETPIYTSCIGTGSVDCPIHVHILLSHSGCRKSATG